MSTTELIANLIAQNRCFNCNKKYNPFRTHQPALNTCKGCIKRMWHLPKEYREKLINNTDIQNFTFFL